MNQKGLSSITLIVVIVAIIAVGGYFVLGHQTFLPVSTFSPTPSFTPTPTPIPTPPPTLSPNPTPILSPTSKAQGISLLSLNDAVFILGTPIKIAWNISRELPPNTYVLISLLGPNDSSKQTGRIAVIPVNHASSGYTWTSSSVTVNGKNYQVLGDRRYWINISLYNGNPDSAGAVKIGEDTSNTSFELAYGGPPIEQ